MPSSFRILYSLTYLNLLLLFLLEESKFDYLIEFLRDLVRLILADMELINELYDLEQDTEESFDEFCSAVSKTSVNEPLFLSFLWVLDLFNLVGLLVVLFLKRDFGIGIKGLSGMAIVGVNSSSFFLSPIRRDYRSCISRFDYRV